MACVTIDVAKYEEECKEKYGEKWLFDFSEKDPDSYLKRGMSRMLLLWLKKTVAIQQHTTFCGRWIKVDEKECCSECGMPRRYSELKNGVCVICGAVMDGGKKDV